MVPPIPPEASKEIEFVKGLVARHFPVYDIRVTYDVVEFFCRVDSTTLEENFELLRQDMDQHGYIPLIAYDKGEHIITVAKKPALKYRSIYVNLALLIVTIITVTIAGAFSWAGYMDMESDALFSQEALAMGMLTFALPLLGILSIHELAHYFAARRRKVAASLPFFIFGPPPLGTFGAFISLRDPIPNKKALLEIGVAGPFAGLLLALPIGFLGLMLTNSEARPVPLNVGSEGVMGVSFPLLYSWISELVPITGDYLLHPTAFAAWVGFLVTALNLLPFGQLDGGHVARALFGARAKYISWVTMAILVGIGIFYFGWLIFALFVFILGARHPPPLNDISPLDTKRKLTGALAFVILVIAFVPIPMFSISADYSFELTSLGDTNVSIAQGGALTMSLMVENVGNTLNEIQLTKGSSPANWSAMFKLHDGDVSLYADTIVVRLNASELCTVDVLMTSDMGSQSGKNYTLVVLGTALNSTVEQELAYNLTVTNPVVTFDFVMDQSTISPGASAYASIVVNNVGSTQVNLSFAPGMNLPAFVDVLLNVGGVNSTTPVEMTVPAHGTATLGVWLVISEFCPAGSKAVSIDVLYQDTIMTILEKSVTVI